MYMRVCACVWLCSEEQRTFAGVWHCRGESFIVVVVAAVAAAVVYVLDEAWEIKMGWVGLGKVWDGTCE